MVNVNIAVRFTLTVAPSVNGSVQASCGGAPVIDAIAEGETITLTVTPDVGYSIDGVSYTSNNTTQAVTITAGAGSFTMPASDTTVTATFALTDPEAKIDGTSYPTLDDALAAAADATIVLCKDITRDKPIVIDKSLTLDLNGRTLQRDLDAPVADGCVIRVEQSADLTVKDESTAKTGKITGGNNTGSGGGIYNRGTLILEGGAITGNKAEDGGGVYNYLGTFVMTGGAITANEAENGGDVYNRGTLNLSGGPSVQNNTQGNVYLPTGRKIQVTGALDAQAAIGIDMESPGAFTQGYPAGGADPDAYFTSDDGALSVRRSPDGGEAMLFAPYTLSTSGCQGAVTFMVNGAAATPDANGNLTLPQTMPSY